MPPISNSEELVSSIRLFCLHLLQQKNTATTIMKDPATPDATEAPMTVPALTCFEPSPVGELDALVMAGSVPTFGGNDGRWVTAGL